LLAWSIAVPVYLAWTLWSWATSRAGVAATNSFLYLVPVSTGLLSVAFLHERLGWTRAIGALLVLVGVVLVTRLRRAEKLEPPAVDSLSRPSTGAAREAGVRAGVAHLAERDLPKVEVAGSSPVSRFRTGVRCAAAASPWEDVTPDTVRLSAVEGEVSYAAGAGH
jgi:hypothetical protein